MGEFVGAAEAIGHFSNNFIMNVQDYWIAGCLDPQHGISEQVACNPGHNILSPGAAVSALSVPAIYELPCSIVGKQDMLFVFVTDDTRLRIREFAATRQC